MLSKWLKDLINKTPFKIKEKTEFQIRVDKTYKELEMAVKNINPNKQELIFICLNHNDDESTKLGYSKLGWDIFIKVHERLLNKSDKYYCWFFFENYESFVNRAIKPNNTIKFVYGLTKKPKNVSVLGVCLRETVEKTLNICQGKCIKNDN